MDADLKGYFDSIPHERLMDRLKEKITDGQVLSLIEQFLRANLPDRPLRRQHRVGVPESPMDQVLGSMPVVHRGKMA